MRRKVVESLPVMAHHFGLSPNEVWELTSAEYKAFHDFLEEMRKAQE